MFHQSIVISTNINEPQLADVIPAISGVLPADFNYSQSNPDVREIRRVKSSIGIAEILPLVAWNMQKPFQGEHKLGIIYEAERLTPEAQNSLLKTLEEPAPGTLICLVTRSRNSLLPTILSRSQHIVLNGGDAIAMGSGYAAAEKFLKAEMLDRYQTISSIADSEESREDAVAFITALMNLLIANPLNYDLVTQNKYLDVCKIALIGLKSGTNIKLTLETVITSMS